MPIFIASLLGGLIQAAGSIAGRVLLSLGIGYVAYTGISALLDGAKAAAISYLQGAPANVVTIMSMLKVDSALSLIFSAVLARLVLKGLTSGTIKRMIVK
ncbi:MAG: DUF2523 domain-containing protein [Burkholderiales bacterium]